MNLKNNALFETFSNAKLVNSQLLNRMGLQVARTYVARWLYNLRPSPADPAISELLRKLRRDGMVVIDNFLPADEFQKLKQESFDILNMDSARISTNMFGPTTYSKATLRDYPEAKTEYIEKFYSDPRLHVLLQAAEKFRFDLKKVHRAIEHVKQGSETTHGDPETELHSDIFFHTHKAWLYLSDVEPKDAPLVFVQGSQRLTVKQAAYIYRHSCNPATPSRRVTPDELSRMGLKETVLTCKQNTLVVANVCGYHRRSVGQPSGERFALLCSVRAQPFLIWRNK